MSGNPCKEVIVEKGRFFETEEGRIVWKMLEQALIVRERAYAPYSNYLVGVALWCKNGKIYVGCNVESADYDGTHAEEAALAAMVADGQRHPRLLVVVGGSRDVRDLPRCLPCGKCRQKLFEFSSLNNDDVQFVDFYAVDKYRLVGISKLLPRAFGPASIGIDFSKYR